MKELERKKRLEYRRRNHDKQDLERMRPERKAKWSILTSKEERKKEQRKEQREPRVHTIA